MFNGPRCGINFNDNLGGGNELKNNLLFNWVRETSDHGPFNSWDRMPFLNDIVDKQGTYDVLESYIHHNFIINNYHSLFPLDHDDGSHNYTDTENVLVYGGYKQYLGHGLKSMNNLYLFVDKNKSLNRPYCATSIQAVDGVNGYDNKYSNNTCIMNESMVYLFGFTGKMNNTIPYVDSNTYYTKGGNYTVSSNGNKLNLNEMREKGFDINSAVKDVSNLSNDEMINMCKNLLKMN